MFCRGTLSRRRSRGNRGAVSIRSIRRVASVSLGLFTVAGSGLAALPAAAARATTLHFYEVGQTAMHTDATGQPVTSTNATPKVGDHVDATSLDYVGNHKHHASSFTASDHIACTLASASSAICSGQFAIGGSLLLANYVTVTSSAPVQINAGTGKYKNARGTINSTSIGNSNNSDVTITLTG
jgi:hypothetical protein